MKSGKQPRAEPQTPAIRAGKRCLPNRSQIINIFTWEIAHQLSIFRSFAILAEAIGIIGPHWMSCGPCGSVRAGAPSRRVEIAPFDPSFVPLIQATGEGGILHRKSPQRLMPVSCRCRFTEKTLKNHLRKLASPQQRSMTSSSEEFTHPLKLAEFTQTQQIASLKNDKRKTKKKLKKKQKHKIK